MASNFPAPGRAAAFGALVVLTLLVSGQAPQGQGSQNQENPFDLFKKLMPVIGHARCVNCHGGVDGVSGRGHQPGAQGGVDCVQCHGDAVDAPRAGHWHQPNPAMNFVGKDDKALCSQFADFFMHAGNAQALDHIEHDSLISLAFLGVMGGARSPGQGTPPDPPADPPPMTKRAFVDSTKRWVYDGQAACEMEGTIRVDESVTSNDTVHHGHPATGTHGDNYYDSITGQTGTRTVVITLRNGRYYADVLKADGRTVTTSKVGTIGLRGPCEMWTTAVGTYTTSSSAPVNVAIKVWPDTAIVGGRSVATRKRKYTITVNLPPETTQTRDSSSSFNNCGAGLDDPPPSGESLDWPKWSFVIEGSLVDPNAKNLVGGCDKTYAGWKSEFSVFSCFQDKANQGPWLLDHGANGSTVDGKAIPMRVITTWNIAYRP